MRQLVLKASIALVLALTSCSGDDGDTGNDGPERDTAATEEAGAQGEVEIPDDPLGSQVQWVLDQLAAGSGPDPETAAERFDDEFLNQVEPDEVGPMFAQLRAGGPYTPTSFQSDGQVATLILAGTDDTEWQLHVGIDDDERINLLYIQEAADVPEVDSWEEFDAALTETGAQVSVYAAHHDGDSWEAVHQNAGDEILPLGSVFKLYVLGAVQRAVLDGEISWEDQVTVTDEVRSLPSGELQEADTGTSVTVAEAAEKMISISDNTATDMLIELVGRDAVEEAVAAMGHHDPRLLDPFLTTRELFWLGWSDPQRREEWQHADPERRGAILDDVPRGELDVDAAAVTDPVWSSGIGWFATGADVAAAYEELQELAAEDDTGTVRDLLTINPGVAVNEDDWPYVAYKGGSAPGVLSLSWYLEDDASVAHTLVVQLASDDAALVEQLALIAGIAEQGIELLADG
ncbi:serine hydrolase [Actinobacteria bacterium YIM 96077]|uniref:Serine hydrolase n=1 Tax=Phytoactinopolyspora halophila TaxID=1981511 RepID=A0A329QEW1_9ACTN|nr:serine hydrolase [Phytoactinopolyspora halophila]AYY13440.1 serine hydrolase [Actinobacteria bacterium YIM 96077]RAW10834.1 serine hydrolase [Phytoactinopolyspora halophila]